MEEFEPAKNYMRDLLLADRSTDDDMRMALNYVSLFQRVGATSKERFLIDFPEVVSALDKFTGLSADESGDRLYDLFQRQARAVEEVITGGVTKHAHALYRNELPAGSLLAVCFSRGHVDAAPASDYDSQAKAFIDRLTAPVLEFAIETQGERVLFHGGLTLDGANFRVVAALLKNFREAKAACLEVSFLPATSLSQHLKCSDQSMRQQVRRLREALDPLVVKLGIPLDQNVFIQTKERAGYRLNPSLREIAVADIKTNHVPPIHA